MKYKLVNAGDKEAFRFLLISAAGLGVDIGAAWALIAFSGMLDSIAAILGFSVATVVNYLGHQLWTFRESGQKLSFRRFLIFTGVVVLILAIRLVVLSAIGPSFPGSGLNAPIRLVLAAIVSFWASFFLNKFLVFPRT